MYHKMSKSFPTHSQCAQPHLFNLFNCASLWCILSFASWLAGVEGQAHAAGQRAAGARNTAEKVILGLHLHAMQGAPAVKPSNRLHRSAASCRCSARCMRRESKKLPMNLVKAASPQVPAGRCLQVSQHAFNHKVGHAAGQQRIINLR